MRSMTLSSDSIARCTLPQHAVLVCSGTDQEVYTNGQNAGPKNFGTPVTAVLRTKLSSAEDACLKII